MTTSISDARINTYDSQLFTAQNISAPGDDFLATPERNVETFSTVASAYLGALLERQSAMPNLKGPMPDLTTPQGTVAINAAKAATLVAFAQNVQENDVQSLAVIGTAASNVLNAQLSNIQALSQEVKNVATVSQTGDSNKMERLATTSAAVFGSQAAVTQVTTKSGETGKSSTETTTTSSVSSATPVRSQAAVAGGTDITAASATSGNFINVIGSQSAIELSNMLVLVMTEAEKLSHEASARSSQRAVASAVHAGNKGIDAAKENLTGAITSGVMGVAVQAGVTVGTVKALKNESNSWKNNVGEANQLEHGVQKNISSVDSSADGMLGRGDMMGKNVKAAMSEGHADTHLQIGEKRGAHNQVQIDTQKYRAVADSVSMANRSAQSVIESSAAVEAAEENKQAEMARADQSVNNELASTHEQTAKKAAETQAAMLRNLENTLSTNNSAASSIAERMR